MCTNKKGKIGEAYFDHSWYVINFLFIYNYFNITETVWIVDRKSFQIFIYNYFNIAYVFNN